MSPSSRGIRWSDETKRKIAGKPLQYYRDLEMWVRGHSRSLKLIPFESLGVVSYSTSSNCSAILYFLRYIASYWLKIAKFLYPTCIWRSHRGDPFGISQKCLIFVKPESLGYRVVKKLWQCVEPFPQNMGTQRTDGQTDKRTDIIAMSICWSAIKIVKSP